MLLNHSFTHTSPVAGNHEQNCRLVEIITGAVKCERIFLLGATSNQRHTHSIFNFQSPGCRFISHYFLLVIIPAADKELLVPAQDKIEGNLQHYIPSTVIVMDAGQFEKWLSESHPFAKRVRAAGFQLYGDALPPLLPCDEKTNHENPNIIAQGLGKMQEFMAGSELYVLRKQNSMAAFMLHQALEQALRSLFLAGTGFYINTHNLDKLLRYCYMLSHKLPDIFPRNNPRNEKLFQLMQKAYIDTRYKEYSISSDDLMILLKRVAHVRDILEEQIEC